MLIAISVTGCTTLPTPNLKTTPSVLPNGYCSIVNKSNLDFEGTYIPSVAMDYANLKGVYDSGLTADVSDHQEKDVYEEALDEGNKYGMSVTSAKIWAEVLMVSDEANSLIYDYSALLYNNIVLPKKLYISEGGQYKQDGLLHERDLTYRVEGDFSILTNPPSWRNFFVSPPKEIYRVESSDFAASSLHKDQWKKGFIDGYKEGVCASYLEMLSGLHKLRSDYIGRYQYVVADHGGVTRSPSVKFVDQDVIVEGNAITIGSRIYKVQDRGFFDEQSNWGKTNESR